MIDQRKMIECLLLLETMCLRLATLMGLFTQIIGRGLNQLFAGRRGRRLLSHREIYARNILIGLGVGFTFGGSVGLALFVAWVWDKLERILKK